MLIEGMEGGVRVVVWSEKSYSVGFKRFKAWLVGWLLNKYKTVGRCSDCDSYTFIVDKKDMFEVFADIYRDVEVVRKWFGHAKVAICKEYTRDTECIDVSEVSRPMIIVPKEDIEKLKKIKDGIESLIDSVKWIPVEVRRNDGLIKIGRCEVPVDEALYVAKKVLLELFRSTGLMKLLSYKKEVENIEYKLVTYEPDIVTWHSVFGSVGMYMDGCGFDLENEEAMILVYNILDRVIKQLEEWSEEWAKIKAEVKTVEEMREERKVKDE